MAQYSKWVRPGYVRIDATEQPASDVYVSAYKGDDKVVIVAINISPLNIQSLVAVIGIYCKF